MVTTLSVERLKYAQSKGLLRGTNTDPLDYMLNLEGAGFENVNIKYYTDEQSNLNYQVYGTFLFIILAHKWQVIKASKSGGEKAALSDEQLEGAWAALEERVRDYVHAELEMALHSQIEKQSIHVLCLALSLFWSIFRICIFSLYIKL